MIQAKGLKDASLVVVKAVEIDAPPARVWAALTAPDAVRPWMLDARVRSTWDVGSRITITGTMPNYGMTFQDRGTVLAAEPEQRLQYDYWSQVTRLPDVPENRTLITFVLEAVNGRCRLTVRHERFYSDVEFKHANLFWGSALVVLKRQVEAV